MIPTLADTKPTADIEYLSSAIIENAVIDKFEQLFGRTPISKNVDEPLHVEDTRVPTMISESVDSTIATMLKASAVESSVIAEGELPLIESAVLLYTMLDDTPAQIALDSIDEYQALDEASADTTAHSVSEQPEINISEGVAYLSPDMSTILIGVFVDKDLFAKEFQFRIENSGGIEISPDEKEKVFSELYEELPGGDSTQQPNLRQDLAEVIGLTSAMTPEQQVADEDKAGGPVAQAVPDTNNINEQEEKII